MGVLLVAFVIVSGIAGGDVFNVVLQGVTPGAYFTGATAASSTPSGIVGAAGTTPQHLRDISELLGLGPEMLRVFVEGVDQEADGPYIRTIPPTNLGLPGPDAAVQYTERPPNRSCPRSSRARRGPPEVLQPPGAVKVVRRPPVAHQAGLVRPPAGPSSRRLMGTVRAVGPSRWSSCSAAHWPWPDTC